MKLAWLLVAVGALVGAAWIVRYDVHPLIEKDSTVVTIAAMRVNRWTGETCVMFFQPTVAVVCNFPGSQKFRTTYR